MRIDDFDSQWHFVPFRPELFQNYRRTNRIWIVILAAIVIGVFIATVAPQPVRNAVTATHFGAAAVQKVKALAPNHPPAPPPQPR
jgi:Na+/serine symporter